MHRGIKKIIWGCVLFMAAIILPMAVILIPALLYNSNSNSTVFRAPGTIEVNVEKAGTYSLENKYCTVYEGKSYSLPKELPNGIVFSLKSEADGEVIPIQTSSISTNSEVNGQKQTSVGNFEVKKPGKYLLSISGNFEERIFSWERAFSGAGFAWFFFLSAGISILSIPIMITAFVLTIIGIVNLCTDKRPSDTTPPSTPA